MIPRGEELKERIEERVREFARIHVVFMLKERLMIRIGRALIKGAGA